MSEQLVRPPAVAGTFYPADPNELAQLVDGFVRDGIRRRPPFDPAALSAIVAPHAGYRFSGSVAGSAYALVLHAAARIRRVVLLSPSHRVSFHGLAVSGADAYATPLGLVPLDTDGRDHLLKLPFVRHLEEAHAEEHGIEVHLPFLQRVAPGCRVLPLVVGRADPTEIASALELLDCGDDTLIVISSDLSHYLGDAEARALDRETSEAIELLTPAKIPHNGACGALPLSGLLLYARKHGLTASTLHLANSGDVGGSKERVVGYGTYMFLRELEPESQLTLSPEEQETILDYTKRAVVHAATTGEELNLPVSAFHPKLRAFRSTFVTLKIRGLLRGCIGSLDAPRPLIADAVHNGFGAALLDSRFPRLRKEELPGLEIHLTILSRLEQVKAENETELLAKLRPGKDGVVLQDGPFRGSFLPVMWEKMKEPREFFTRLKEKAGLPPTHWSDTLQVLRYSALLELECTLEE